MKTLIPFLILLSSMTLWAEDISPFAKKLGKTFKESSYIHRKETTALSIYFYATDTPPEQLDRKFASLFDIKNWKQMPDTAKPDQAHVTLLKRIYHHKIETHKVISLIVTSGKTKGKKYLFTITRVTGKPKK